MTDSPDASSAIPRQCCVVFWASGGIGSVLCRQLDAQGEVVIAVGRSAAKMQELASELSIESAVLNGSPLRRSGRMSGATARTALSHRRRSEMPRFPFAEGGSPDN
jgi:NADP-dependent 3-hydroxy acid dehydrogenase YdfG